LRNARRERKSKGKGAYFLVRLTAIFSGNPSSPDPMVIYFNEKAEEGFDSKLDALKLMNTDLNVPNLYALIPGGSKLSINAMPEIADSSIIIPLGLKIYKSDEISFKIRDIENLPSGTKIYLYDAITTVKQDLLPDKEYKISLAAGEYADRFSLQFFMSSTEVHDVYPSSDLFIVYSSFGILKTNIRKLEDGIGTIYVFDLLGHQVLNKKVYDTGYYEIETNFKPGIYIVRYISGNIIGTKKIFINKR